MKRKASIVFPSQAHRLLRVFKIHPCQRKNAEGRVQNMNYISNENSKTGEALLYTNLAYAFRFEWLGTRQKQNSCFQSAYRKSICLLRNVGAIYARGFVAESPVKFMHFFMHGATTAEIAREILSLCWVFKCLI